MVDARSPGPRHPLRQLWTSFHLKKMKIRERERRKERGRDREGRWPAASTQSAPIAPPAPIFAETPRRDSAGRRFLHDYKHPCRHSFGQSGSQRNSTPISDRRFGYLVPRAVPGGSAEYYLKLFLGKQAAQRCPLETQFRLLNLLDNLLFLNTTSTSTSTSTSRSSPALPTAKMSATIELPKEYG